MISETDRMRDQFVAVCRLMVEGADRGKHEVPPEKLALARKAVDAWHGQRMGDVVTDLAAAISRARVEAQTDEEFEEAVAPHAAALQALKDEVDDVADEFVALAARG